MKLLEKQIRDILERIKEEEVTDSDIQAFAQELISTFRIYLEERDSHQWGDKFEGVSVAMRRAKSYDAQYLESESQ